MTTFIRLLDAPVDAKPAALKAAVTGVGSIFECAPEAFAAVPGSPFAYWVSEAVRASFRRLPAFETKRRTVKVGLQTSDDVRFVRTWWEVPSSAACIPQREGGHSPSPSGSGGGVREERWLAFAKGGAFSPFYADVFLCENWELNGQLLDSFAASVIRNPDHYFRPGLTWPRRTTSGFGIRALPAGCIFADKGPAAFVAGDDTQDLLALSALLNSSAFGYLLGVQLAAADAAARSYEVGVIQRTPVPDLTPDDRAVLAALARRAWSLRRALDRVIETSHAFVLPPGLNERVTGLDPAAIVQELAEIQREIDDRAFGCYRLGPEDRRRIESGFGASPPPEPGVTDAETEVQGSGFRVQQSQAEPQNPEPRTLNPEPRTLNPEPRTLNPERPLSWLIGVAFARFDPRLATGERPIPPEPEPFDPLPARSPGMVPEGDEPEDRPDILVDDEGHADDLVGRVQSAVGRIEGKLPTAFCLLPTENLRGWLAKDFFPLHIRMYSKSRRKAPIYWQLATPSASYSVWLYIHAFTKDTLFRVQNDFAAPKLAHEERRLESLTAELRDGAAATERKALAEQQDLVEELRAFLAEVKRVPPLWNPNLDDGVIINFAPLWRLVPQHRAWQKELKSTWDALCAGKYDWAHLAMHLWPERVIPKCAYDRSLAIAHGLEGVFWEEQSSVVSHQSSGEKSSVVGHQASAGDAFADDRRPMTDDAKPGKWQPKKVPTSEIEQLIAERTSAAVKDALKSLLDAPAPVKGRGGGRRSPARRTAGRRSTAPQARSSGPVSARSEPPETAVLDAVKKAIAENNGGASKSDVLTTTGLTDAQWNAAINALLADGAVTKVGAGRGTRYHLKTDD